MNRRKSSRKLQQENMFRKSFTRKRKLPPNKWQVEGETATIESSAKKLQRFSLSDVLMPEDDNFNYRILDFNSVFAEISQHVECKQRSGNVKFQTESTRRAGLQDLGVV